MSTRKVDPSSLHYADIIALDREGQLALLVEVNATHSSPSEQDSPDARKEKATQRSFECVPYLRSAEEAGRSLPLFMLVDLDSIDVIEYELLPRNDNHPEPIGPPGGGINMAPQLKGINLILSLRTADILSHYDSEFRSKRVYYTYLVTLVDTWLRDLAYRWKSDTPPGFKELAEIGLLQRLEGGTTQVEGPPDDDPLY